MTGTSAGWGVGDQLDRTARQVRLDRDDLPVHDLTADWVVDGSGVTYATCCGRVLTKAEGAMLTTREVTCTGCMAAAKLGDPR